MAEPWRDTGISAVGDAPWGTHFCHFFDTKQDLLDILIPYFQAGLNAHELCVWITYEPLTRQEAIEALQSVVPGADERLGAGDIRIVPYSEWYVAGGVLDLDHVMERWREIYRHALDTGYSGLRVNGNEAWLREQDRQNFSEYEVKLNDIVRDKQMLLLCSYPLRGTTAGDLFDLARAHDFLIARK